MSADETRDLKQAFDLFDRNGDGHISAQELGTVMRQLGFSPSDKEIRRMIAEVDKNTNSMVEFEEFVMLMRKHKALVDREADMRQAFRSFDANDDGSISREELRQAMERLGEKLSEAELDAMISAADLNKDGKVNYEEFMRMWLQK